VIDFDDKIPTRVARRLRKLDEAFERYAEDKLFGEELDAGPLLLGA